MRTNKESMGVLSGVGSYRLGPESGRVKEATDAEIPLSIYEEIERSVTDAASGIS